ncbi:MAG: protein translocase subunit SecDF [Saprospiraceae bacterium]
MQGKGIVKFFLIVMTLVTLVQYALIYPTSKAERKADAYAQAASNNAPDELQKKAVFKVKRAEYLDSISNKLVVDWRPLLSFTYQQLKARQLALGLDLKGGMSIIMQVDLKNFIKALAGNSQDPALAQALTNTSNAQKADQADYITLFAREYGKVANGKKLASLFYKNAELREEINFESSDGDVISALRTRANEAVNRTFELLKQRIDKLGVTQPNVFLDSERDLIVVELPGIDNPERARNFLQAAAKLEFYNVYRMGDPGIQDAFLAANERLIVTEGVTQVEREIKSTDLDTVYVRDSTGAEITPRQIERIDTMPNTENTLKRGPLFERFTLNGAGPRAYGQAVMGTALESERARIDTFLNREDIKNLFPRDAFFRWGRKPVKDFETKEITEEYELYALRMEPNGKAPLTGDYISQAGTSLDQRNNEMSVSLRMAGEGVTIWRKMTEKAAADNNREIAILLDNEIVSAPGVQNPIPSGDSQITGDFTIEEATDLASILEIGSLPAETKIIQQSVVGPSLGAENISKSMIAMIIGFLIVLAFMIFYYGGGGIIAVIALFLNVFFIFGALASYGAVLTLPGIAGIVLIMGMAVDANVIIYERVREELREGKALATAVSEGFRHSYSAIIDSNVTTILSAMVLAYFGLGPIKGFAVVLIIGVLCTMFTAVLIARLMFDYWLGKGRSISFSTAPTKNALSKVNFDWLGYRKYAYMFSAGITLIGLVSFFTRGFELGVDFKGGYSYNITFDNSQRVEAEQVRQALAPVFDGKAPLVKAIDTENTYNVVTDYLINATEPINGVEPADMVMRQLYKGVNTLSGGTVDSLQFKDPDGAGTHIESSSKVGPTIADDITRSAFWALGSALLLIFLYIFIRFSKWQYSLGAVAALFHDTLIVLSLFSLFHGIAGFSLEIDQAFIAAILTVIGYSVNDTVIVFDRIREYLGLHAQGSRKEIINRSLNVTLSRTSLTSATTLFTVIVLFFFGGASIKGFAFALLAGILAGTYSSVYIATALMYDFTRDKNAEIVHTPKKTTTRATASSK